MVRFAQQDAVQKATIDQLAAIAALLAPLTRNPSAPSTTIHRHLFQTDLAADLEHRATGVGNPTANGAVQTIDEPEMTTIR